MGRVIRRAQVIEFAGFWSLDGDFLANSILSDSLEPQALILLARADGAGDLRCDPQAGRDSRKGQDQDARISIMARANAQGPDTLPQTCLRPTRTSPLADRGRAIHSVHTAASGLA